MHQFKYLVVSGLFVVMPMQVMANPNMAPIISYLILESTEVLTITSPTTNKIWMDRNLGATMACTESRDSVNFADDAAYVVSQQDCFGDYYQWGRDADGHEKSDSATTSTQATDTSTVGHGDFITSGNENGYDWAQTVDGDGRIRETNWNPCPSGFRIPTSAEFDAEKEGITNRDDAYTKLKLPSAGYRSGFYGSLNSQGLLGDIWSITVSNTVYYSSSVGLGFDSSTSLIGIGDRTGGQSVRCLKD